MAVREIFVVWNAARNEAVVFDNRDDAKSATNGKPHRKHGYMSISSLAEAFYESYGDEKLKIEKMKEGAHEKARAALARAQETRS